MENLKQIIYNTTIVNLESVKEIFDDIEIREFPIIVGNKIYDAFFAFINGKFNKKLLYDFVIKPLKNLDTHSSSVLSEVVASNITIKKVTKTNLSDIILNALSPQNKITKVLNFEKLKTLVNLGNCILFIDTLDFALSVDINDLDFIIQEISEKKQFFNLF